MYNLMYISRYNRAWLRLRNAAKSDLDVFMEFHAIFLYTNKPQKTSKIESPQKGDVKDFFIYIQRAAYCKFALSVFLCYTFL